VSSDTSTSTANGRTNSLGEILIPRFQPHFNRTDVKDAASSCIMLGNDSWRAII
jgi:hypothetical protein